MTPYEVMLSESQERMLVIVKKGNEDKVRALFDKWDLTSAIIGQVIDEPVARIKEGDQVVAEAPVEVLTEAPQYRREGVEAAAMPELRAFDFSTMPAIPPLGMDWDWPDVLRVLGRLSELGQQAGGLSSLRPPGDDQHGGAARIRRGGAAD